MSNSDLSQENPRLSARLEDHTSSNESDITETDVGESLRLIEDLKYFLATAPVNWQPNQVIRRYFLGGEDGFVSCVFWNNLYYITGTDILRCCFYRMEKFGRKIVDKKKFQEGIFSDLRALKIGDDATLEPARSPFLKFLHKNSCLKTQKKQKVFYWFSVQHDKLFADALERDLKRELLGLKSTSVPVREPALSFEFNEVSRTTLYDQLTKHMEVRNMVSPVQNLSQENKFLSEEFNNALKKAVLQDTVSNDITNSNEALSGSPAGNQLSTNAVSKSPSPLLDSVPPQALSNEPNADISPAEQSNIYQEVFPVDTLSGDQQMFSAYGENVSTRKTEMRSGSGRNSIDRTCIVVVNDQDDFPLDYFPVKVEYPDKSQDVVTGPSMKKFMNPLFSSSSETSGNFDFEVMNSHSKGSQINSAQSEFNIQKDLQLSSAMAHDLYDQDLPELPKPAPPSEPLHTATSSATLKSSIDNMKNSIAQQEGSFEVQELQVLEKSKHTQDQLKNKNDQSYMDYLLSPEQPNFSSHPPPPPHAPNPYYPEHQMYYPYMPYPGTYSNHPYTSTAPFMQQPYFPYRQHDYYYGYPYSKPPNPMAYVPNQHTHSYGVPFNLNDTVGENGVPHAQSGTTGFGDVFSSPAHNNLPPPPSGPKASTTAATASSHPHHAKNRKHHTKPSFQHSQIAAANGNVPISQYGPYTPMFGRIFPGNNGSATAAMFPPYIHSNSPILTTTPVNANKSWNAYYEPSNTKPPTKPNKVVKKKK
ncbi:Protein STE12 [Hanseniaspora osmophila]|uniref:Protein STE12 n=1 Tax=Hanseniaspora osmophila TaxID=56408 RepID=A0A1E5R1F5_9ASCO|nr:Protein STE12 [Hanseniaspora osmophila]